MHIINKVKEVCYALVSVSPFDQPVVMFMYSLTCGGQTLPFHVCSCHSGDWTVVLDIQLHTSSSPALISCSDLFFMNLKLFPPVCGDWRLDRVLGKGSWAPSVGLLLSQLDFIAAIKPTTGKMDICCHRLVWFSVQVLLIFYIFLSNMFFFVFFRNLNYLLAFHE